MDFNNVLTDIMETRRQKAIVKGSIAADLIVIAITGVSIVGVSVIAAEVAILAGLHFKAFGGIKYDCKH